MQQQSTEPPYRKPKPAPPCENCGSERTRVYTTASHPTDEAKRKQYCVCLESGCGYTWTVVS